ncbi:hypothetical protein P9K31_15225 [Corynebacterium glutamicum]|uniref:Uncharacterized protein n=1 Tax=Corynebacterium glutamicum (strain R) TaxID=340322 RepID=A0AB72VF16_CORGB|nr:MULTISPECIES: hypothetical protein [Corynebacterium]ALP51460.1 hypothetical protein AC079_15460 [Corynebacterium glutamicum]ANR63980.1 hypothetical protein C628_15500 [[Brevibacterium] flavum ZL-1]ANR66988.1 hypothetical protein C627_15365 [Corynebacterium glutamicum ZL-6]ANU34984.1 hypothetical protein BBD29_15235 [Corynebacterium glutamicum]APT08735.1 hypothetical protein BSP99_15705 [Corynebacterium glutamicum]
MSAPMFELRTNAELQAELDDLLLKIKPFDVEQLKRLRDADAISSEEADLLDRIKALTWLING